MGTKQDFLSIADITPQQVRKLVEDGLRMKGGKGSKPLDGAIIALLFEKPSLRTRSSFEVGIRQLGGQTVYFGRDEVGLGVRESVADVTRVLDRMFNGLIARVFSHANLIEMARYTRLPVVNALSDAEHPCQAMADLLTMRERFGELRGRRVAYIGDGNNVAVSLGLACASVGTDFVLASPPDYRIPDAQWKEMERRAKASGSKVEWIEKPRDAVAGADCVYTDVWTSMGQEGEQAVRAKAFGGYQVNPELMQRAKPGAIFMHDMPAHEGEEISKGMLDHPTSVAFDQAENRLHAQKAVLAWLFQR
ncbi:MAG: ornithine carbamoyltransferase [SAR202 cluster bacterium]|nr:ornithine carbamoyltransferase [SAR202 cluster bacterium]